MVEGQRKVNGNGAPEHVTLAFPCVCGGTLRANPGDFKAWIWVCNQEGGGLEVIQANAAARGLDWRRLIDDPALLGEPLTARRRTALPTPTAGYVPWLTSCARRLRRSVATRRYLIGERGISREVLEAAGVGWDGKCNTFPMYNNGELVAWKMRRPRAGAQMICCPGSGRAWPLYPRVPGDDAVVLVAGELDALCGLSHGLATCSVTLGAGTWLPAWTEDLRGKRAAVCFDRNEAHIARQRVDMLIAAGVEAWRLRLPRSLGAKGDLSDYLARGGNVQDLLK